MSEEDWKSIHLNWIKRNPNFVPKNGDDLSEPYYEIMKFTYQNPNATQVYAKRCLVEDIEWKKKSDKIISELFAINQSSISHFITIGFNHQTWSVSQCVNLINLIMNFDWVDGGKAVFELNRENGQHPHCHFLIQSKLPKSKIIEKIWAAKGIKKIVLQKSFIDYKVAMPYHDKYVLGDKQDDKLKYVEMDRQWREKNNIKHLFEK